MEGRGAAAAAVPKSCQLVFPCVVAAAAMLGEHVGAICLEGTYLRKV